MNDVHPWRRIGAALKLLLLAGIALAATLVVTPAAQAGTERNGHCDEYEFCYYFNSNQGGSVSDFKEYMPNLGDRQPSCFDFKGSGNGKGICVKNNAASVWNRLKSDVKVYYNSGFRGLTQTIKPGQRANLIPGLKNNNAGHKIVLTGGVNPNEPYPPCNRKPSAATPSVDTLCKSNSGRSINWPQEMTNMGHWKARTERFVIANDQKVLSFVETPAGSPQPVGHDWDQIGNGRGVDVVWAGLRYNHFGYHGEVWIRTGAGNYYWATKSSGLDDWGNWYRGTHPPR